MAITWVDGGTPALSAANLNSMVADEQTALFSAAALSTKTANYTATSTDKVLIYNGSSITATLPDPTTVTNRIYIIKNIHTTALSVVSAGTSKTIDGAASIAIQQYMVLTVVSNGTAWFSLSGADLVPTANGARVYTAVASSTEAALWADSSGTGARPAFRATTDIAAGNAIEAGYYGSGTYYRNFVIKASGQIIKLSNTDFTITVTGSNPQDSIASGVYGVTTETGAGLTYLKRNNTGAAWPAWNFQPYGYFGQPKTQTANYTVDCRDTLLIGNGSSITITLPDPTDAGSSGIIGRKFEFKNIHSTSLTIVSAGTSKTIDGASSLTLAQWAKATVISNGTQWLIVSS